jgi:hypothetical protein
MKVWLTDQSDTAIESGGVLYIYDGFGPRAANPSTARPAVTPNQRIAIAAKYHR